MDWERFYHYPYVYYPQNFWGNEYYRSADSLYYRYPAEMRIPVYNRHWFSDYPTPRPYYKGPTSSSTSSNRRPVVRRQTLAAAAGRDEPVRHRLGGRSSTRV